MGGVEQNNECRDASQKQGPAVGDELVGGPVVVDEFIGVIMPVIFVASRGCVKNRPCREYAKQEKGTLHIARLQLCPMGNQSTLVIQCIVANAGCWGSTGGNDAEEGNGDSSVQEMRGDDVPVQASENKDGDCHHGKAVVFPNMALRGILAEEVIVADSGDVVSGWIS